MLGNQCGCTRWNSLIAYCRPHSTVQSNLSLELSLGVASLGLGSQEFVLEPYKYQYKEALEKTQAHLEKEIRQREHTFDALL